MGPVLLLSSLAVSALAAAGTTRATIRTAADLSAATFDRAESGRRFDLVGTAVTDCRDSAPVGFSLKDDTGAVIIRKDRPLHPDVHFPAGTRVRVTGTIWLGAKSRNPFADCDSITILGEAPLLPPPVISPQEFYSGRYDCQPVTVRGTVRDIVRDETDPAYAFVFLSGDNETVCLALPTDSAQYAQLTVGTEIQATGLCHPSCLTVRRLIGRILMPLNGGIRILSTSTADPFETPEISDFRRLRPQEIARLGRHRTDGCVLATWGGDRALLRTHQGNIVQLELATARLPEPGTFIEAVGFPESDLYRINLSRAIWRPVNRPDIPAEQLKETSAEALLTDTAGRRRFDPLTHGKLIRLRGTVCNLPGNGNDDGRFNIESGSFIVPVDVSSAPDAIQGLRAGCEISVSGICIMETDNWRPNAPFPTIRGFAIVVRTPADITILKRPSWWTPARLSIGLAALFVFLIGSLAWNALLKRLAERRGRELAQSAIAKAESDLKVYERTRLAVELHDSISQYLTGISLAIRAAVKLALGGPDGLRQNLALASASLDSCRRELRNCLWDLRNRTLDETDINAAIRQTLAPLLGDCELSIRFNVPRDRFSDNSAHAILHILRELAINAVRHGKAKHVWVAGSIEGDRLLFSVRDNGVGFDPSGCPGMDQGHFGLQGIRERINQFEGQISIESKPGTETKITIILNIPGSKEKEP